MQEKLITYAVSFNPLEVNLDGRLKELPFSAWKRLTADKVGMKNSRFRDIIYNRVKTLYIPELDALSKVLNCTHEDILNPNYQFQDFRTPEEIAEDLNPVKD